MIFHLVLDARDGGRREIDIEAADFQAAADYVALMHRGTPWDGARVTIKK